MRASRHGHQKLMEVLLAHKADVNCKTNVSRGEACEGAPMGVKTMDWVLGFEIKVILWPNEKE